MLLIHPPLSKPCEPPAGIAALAGALAGRRVPLQVLDANLEGLLHLLEAEDLPAGDAWTRRALRQRREHLSLLRSPKGYGNIDRYGRAVRDLDRALSAAAGRRLTFSDYDDPDLSPLRSADLLRSAEAPERNPFFPWFSRRLEPLLAGSADRIVGFSLNYLSQALSTFAMIGWLRRSVPHCTVVLGGGLVTSWMNRPDWRNPFAGLADRLVAGPGEGPLLEMTGETPGNAPAPPRFRDLPIADYLAPGFVLPYAASRGCWWRRCSFCPERAEGNAYLSPAPGDVLSELREIALPDRPVLLHFLDNALSPSLLTALSGQSPGVPWYGFARFVPALRDFDFCRSLRRSGCVLLKFGLESGDQGVLDALEKGIDLGEVSLILGNLKRAGIATYVYLLFGTPPEAEAEARRTLEFAAAHADRIGFLNVALFNLPAHAPEAEKLDTRPFFEGDLSLYRDFRHPRGWDRRVVRRFLGREFLRHPAIAAILRKDPPVFTSNHAAFFTEGMAVPPPKDGRR
ncbi:MAG TPA: radical SAM protein [Syntrophales bacterium]|nr:radical SAM protein [Syntrophales bacterium]